MALKSVKKPAPAAAKGKSRPKDEDEDERDLLEDEDEDADDADEDEDEDEAPRKKSAPASKSKAPAKSAKSKSRDDDDDDGGDDDVIDFSDTEEDSGELELIKPGKYEAIVDESTYSESKEKGTPMITLRFEFEGGDYDGRKLWYRIFFTPKMAGRLKRDLRILMGKAPTGSMNKRGFVKLADSGKLIGQRAILHVVKRKYNDEDRNDVRRLIDASEETEEGDGGFLD